MSHGSWSTGRQQPKIHNPDTKQVFFIKISFPIGILQNPFNKSRVPTVWDTIRDTRVATRGHIPSKRLQSYVSSKTQQEKEMKGDGIKFVRVLKWSKSRVVYTNR